MSKTLPYRLLFLLSVLSILPAGCGKSLVVSEEDIVSKPYLVNTPLESRSISFENPTGAKGKGGMAASRIGVGRKGAALTNIDPGQTVTLCDVQGPAVIRRMWVTLPAKPENLLGFVIRGYSGRQHLKGHPPIHRVLPRIIHNPHPSATDLAAERVVAEGAEGSFVFFT